MGTNGTAGAQAIKAVGGLCVAQDPETADSSRHAAHLIDPGYADYILGPRTCRRCCFATRGHPYVGPSTRRARRRASRCSASAQHLREILAILRTRTRHDFTGYKKPTLLRRIQRRMGLRAMQTLGDYAELPAEARRTR